VAYGLLKVAAERFDELTAPETENEAVRKVD